jgi:hypothetical protein
MSLFSARSISLDWTGNLIGAVIVNKFLYSEFLYTAELEDLIYYYDRSLQGAYISNFQVPGYFHLAEPSL